MTILALYVPKPDELVSAMFGLSFALAVLTGVAVWLRLPARRTSLAMFVGAVAASAPGVITRWNADLGGYGDMARDWSSTKYSDTYFAITYYFSAEWGCLIALGGMIAGPMFQGVTQTSRNRNQPTADQCDA